MKPNANYRLIENPVHRCAYCWSSKAFMGSGMDEKKTALKSGLKRQQRFGFLYVCWQRKALRMMTGLFLNGCHENSIFVIQLQ